MLAGLPRCESARADCPQLGHYCRSVPQALVCPWRSLVSRASGHHLPQTRVEAGLQRGLQIESARLVHKRFELWAMSGGARIPDFRQLEIR